MRSVEPALEQPHAATARDDAWRWPHCVVAAVDVEQQQQRLQLADALSAVAGNDDIVGDVFYVEGVVVGQRANTLAD